MSFTVIIPARYGSSRFPGKVLTDLAGQTMLARVYQQACLSGAKEVVVATDHPLVEQEALKLNARICKTSPDHCSGSDRAAEAAVLLGLDDDEVIVNVQCDQPLIEPALITQVARSLLDNKQIKVATMATPIMDAKSLHDSDIVKLVLSGSQKALYFSRAVIPHSQLKVTDLAQQHLFPSDQYYRHIGLYGYRVAMLQQFVAWDPAPIEQLERLEQLRLLWRDIPIHVELTEKATTVSIDKPQDVDKVLALLDG